MAMKVQTLREQLRHYKQELNENEESRLHFTRIIEKYKDEAYRRRFSGANKRKAAEQQDNGRSVDCLKIKKLLVTLEQVEADNTRLRNIIMVVQQSSIQKLQNEVDSFPLLLSSYRTGKAVHTFAL